MYMVEISLMQHHFHFWDSSPLVLKEMVIFNFWGRMSAKFFFLLQFFISLGKPKFDIISFFLGHLIQGESRFYSQCSWGLDFVHFQKHWLLKEYFTYTSVTSRWWCWYKSGTTLGIHTSRNCITCSKHILVFFHLK